MPELLALLPCEKVIIDQQNNPTIVNVLEKIHVHVPAGHSVPGSVITPKEWAVFTLWRRSEEEAGRKFEQHIEVLLPNESVAIRANASFTFNDTMHRLVSLMLGFPVGQQGACVIRTWLEAEGRRTTQVFTYVVEVIHQTVRQPAIV